MTPNRVPTIDEFAEMAEQAWAQLPDGFRALCGSIVIRVDDFADREVLDHFGMTNPYQLSGLYTGVDLTRKSVMNSGGLPDQVFLYRKPILAEWQARGDISLYDLITHVLVHEIGHHFGLSDDHMHSMDGSR